MWKIELNDLMTNRSLLVLYTPNFGHSITSINNGLMTHVRQCDLLNWDLINFPLIFYVQRLDKCQDNTAPCTTRRGSNSFA